MDVQPATGSDKHIVVTTPVSWDLVLRGTPRLGFLLTVELNFPTMLQRIVEQASATAALPVVAGSDRIPTGMTVDLDLVEVKLKMKKIKMMWQIVVIPAELMQQRLMKERLQQEFLYDYFVITTSGWLDLPWRLL